MKVRKYTDFDEEWISRLEGSDVTVDNDIPANLLSALKALDGIFDAKLVNFYAI